jgi:glycerol-3-phosphate acyltransferase PlsY
VNRLFQVICVFILAYILGGIPFGLLIGKLKGIDIRKYGSGNIGATNVSRIMGFLPGVIVLILDASKAALAVFLMKWIGYDSPTLLIMTGVVAVTGHTWSIFLKFKGGRGVASAFGVLLVVAPLVAITAVGVWALVVAITRYISVGSLIAASWVPLAMFLLCSSKIYALGAFMLFMVITYRHIPNIKRLLSGTENRLGERASNP